jgi:hypothetical protein
MDTVTWQIYKQKIALNNNPTSYKNESQWVISLSGNCKRNTK